MKAIENKMKYFFIFIISMTQFQAIASKNNDQPLWQKILESKSILRVMVNSVVENTCNLTVSKSLFGNRDSGETFVMKYSETHVRYLGRNWIAENSQYIIFLKGTRRNTLSSIFDKMKIISDSVFISSRTLNDLPAHPKIKFDLFPNTDAGNSIGYKVPLSEFEGLLEYIVGNFRLNCLGSIKRIKKQDPGSALNQSTLFNLMIEEIGRVIGK